MKLGDLYKNSVHYVSHKNSIHENLTVLENLQYYAEIVEGQILIPTAIHYMKLDNYLEWPASKLSAGWKRRLSLSRLMLSNRKIWLLDEPAASLDRETSASLGRLITTRADTGGIVIFTSHGELEIPKATEFTMEDFVCLDS
jgi:heme exporter protein A